MAKRLFIDLVRSLFLSARQHPLLQKIMVLPLFVRYTVGFGLVLFGILGIFTPIPLGIVFLLIGITLFSGFAKTRNIVFRVIYWLRLHIIYSKIYMWWRNR
ncbi:hypothetical protein K2X92_01885 [Candidatus Gracilibacteria bacterium]|nr:hypothetical protein [Candidatus Gracilibacteria bacterium]